MADGEIMAEKLQVKVCVGSSCHIQGGTKTLRALESLIEGEHLSDQVELKADLCLENCLQAPNVVVDGTIHGGITPDRAAEFFKSHILPRTHQ